MLTIISLMLVGILTGYALRTRKLAAAISAIITWLIWLLLFFLGVEVGGNNDVVNRLPIIGAKALFLSMAATLGSMLLAKALWAYITRKQPKKEEDASDER